MSLEEFLRGPHQRGRGSSAEADGVAWLESHGYRILGRNVVSRCGEIDVVAVEGDTLCFVEIKARRSERYGPPALAVTPAKQHRLTRCARAYLARRAWQGPCRFDVLAMLAVQGTWRYDLIRGAFAAAG